MRYEHMNLDQERALYGIRDAQVVDCRFSGPADGESALKETHNIAVQDCHFDLRYPLWHVHGGELAGCTMSQTCRAALWYDENLRISNCKMEGIKALRECQKVQLKDCQINSSEFGWRCAEIHMNGCELTSEYPFLFSRDLEFDALTLQGKYSFQYVQDAVIRNSVLHTKDAFWHSRNVTVVDSVIEGEYLGWYSENLHLIRCRILGTQPLCYARGLVMEDCQMEGADLAFENSDVQAVLRGEVISVKNPRHGRIEADQIGQIIWDEHRLPESDCEVVAKAHTAL